eukprot:scaffold94451_cov78-Phaeocystis_antarctica.AAC.4
MAHLPCPVSRADVGHLNGKAEADDQLLNPPCFVRSCDVFELHRAVALRRACWRTPDVTVLAAKPETAFRSPVAPEAPEANGRCPGHLREMRRTCLAAERAYQHLWKRTGQRACARA